VRRLTFLLLFLPFLGVSGCGGEDTAAPEFPRAFTAVTDSCTVVYMLDVELDTFVESVGIRTVHASTESFFPRLFCFMITRVRDRTGAILEEHLVQLPCYNEAGEPIDRLDNWSLTLAFGPTDWSFTGTGTGHGELSGRSIEFVMEPLFEECEQGNCQCRFATTGTIW